MPIKFIVSAPGKVILNGEHSVVYNKAALAGVVGLRNYLSLAENDSDVVTIAFDIFNGISVAFRLENLNEFIAECQNTFDFSDFPNNMEETHEALLTSVTVFIERNAKLESNEIELTEETKKALSAVVYFIVSSEASKSSSLTTGFELKFKSEITHGAGLGSSASYAVCLAAAILTYSMVRSKSTFVREFNAGSMDERSYFKNLVSNFAFLSEKIMHGNPSGLDNSICTFGNVVKFMKNPQRIIDVNLKSKLNILLVNSGVSRNTLAVVQRVKQLRDDHQAMVDSILNAMNFLVEDVVDILEREYSEENFEKLRRLFTINNNLLRSLGVSHPELEKIFDISERNGFSCKLTGAGAGGYAIVLLPDSYYELPTFKTLCNELTAKGFQWNATTIGGDGLQLAE